MSETPSRHKSSIVIKGEGSDEAGRHFKLAVKGKDIDIPPFSVAQITKDPLSVLTELNNAGANVFTSKARNVFLEELQAWKPCRPAFKVASKLGWHGKSAYVLPDEIFGKAKRPIEPVFRHLDPLMLGKYHVAGTLTDWQQQIGDLCTGNSRLMLAVSVAFAGPILPLVSRSEVRRISDLRACGDG